MSRNSNKVGQVFLVGAGPGDPGMLTLRAAQCLGRADTVLYDYLVNPQILRHAASGAELICLGKHGRDRIWSQEEINEYLVRAARDGRTVVRLKGGDPAVFARGAQEVECLQDAGIAFEVVPGITTALAAGSCAGIPVTHRDQASAVALVTGQQQPGTAQLDYGQLVDFPGTLVFYMGVTTAPHWTEALIAAGKSPDTPAAIIRRCSYPDQLSIRCTLGEVVERLTVPRQVRPPVIVVVGDVASVPAKFSWFEQRRLFRTTILVTRPFHQAASLEKPLEELGAEVLVQPAIRVGDPESWDPVDDAIARLDQFDWLVFSSSNGVQYFLNRLASTGRDLRALGGLRLAAMGPGTAAELARYHLETDAQPDQYRAELLAAKLAPDARGRRFLLARASRGREVLAETLTAVGAVVEQIVVYSSVDVTQPDNDIQTRLAAGEIGWTTITSSAIARSLVSMFDADLRKTKLASISPVTSATLRELGFEPAAEASEYTMEGMVAAIVAAS